MYHSIVTIRCGRDTYRMICQYQYYSCCTIEIKTKYTWYFRASYILVDTTVHYIKCTSIGLIDTEPFHKEYQLSISDALHTRHFASLPYAVALIIDDYFGELTGWYTCATGGPRNFPPCGHWPGHSGWCLIDRRLSWYHHKYTVLTLGQNDSHFVGDFSISFSSINIPFRMSY